MGVNFIALASKFLITIEISVKSKIAITSSLDSSQITMLFLSAIFLNKSI